MEMPFPITHTLSLFLSLSFISTLNNITNLLIPCPGGAGLNFTLSFRSKTRLSQPTHSQNTYDYYITLKRKQERENPLPLKLFPFYVHIRMYPFIDGRGFLPACLPVSACLLASLKHKTFIYIYIYIYIYSCDKVC